MYSMLAQAEMKGYARCNSLDLKLKVIRPSKSDIINTLPKVIRF